MTPVQVDSRNLHQLKHFGFPPAFEGAAPLPDGFPKMLNSELAWTGSTFHESSGYIQMLNAQDILELEIALEHFKSLGLDGDLVNKDNFPLPSLSAKLEHIRMDLHQGRGFGLVRGLNPKKYSVEDLTVLHLGIQSYIANNFGRQDKRGNMLVHIVADDSTKTKADHHRHSTAPITFHNEEAGDIVSWLTRNTAATGGRCIISSAYTVYNVLAAARPDLIRVLARSDWPFALPKFHCRPVIFYDNCRLITNFGRGALLGSASHPRPDFLPKLTPIQIEALDAIENIAKATQLEIATKAGDIHFINNLAVFHRREGFVNGASEMEKRHLVRMRLRDDKLGWKIPQELEAEWNLAFEGPAAKMWHLEPMPEGFFPLRYQLN